MSKIHFLPVYHGDCFVIECDKGDHSGVVVVDGGPTGGAKILQPILEEIGTPDLLVLTHFDGDHIQGLIDYIESCQGILAVPAKEVWANCAGDVKVKDDNFSPIMLDSAKQGVELARLLNAMARTGKMTWRDDIAEGFIPDDCPFASIEVISPTEEMRDLAIGQQEEQAQKMPMAVAMDKKKMTRADDIDIPLDILAKGKPAAPNKKNDVPNASSIAFILRCDGLSILMLGDSFPQNVEAYLRSKGYSEDNPLEVDFVKVAHHGSKHNTSNELLDIIKCNHYLISTNGKIYQHPDRDSIAHILCHPKRDRNEKVHLYFNCAVEEIEQNSKKKFLKDGEDVEWNFEIHENATEIEGLGAAEVAPEADGCAIEEPNNQTIPEL
jgi:beta-lactamase superfamily II metal-dependent hydrolase